MSSSSRFKHVWVAAVGIAAATVAAGILHTLLVDAGDLVRHALAAAVIVCGAAATTLVVLLERIRARTLDEEREVADRSREELDMLAGKLRDQALESEQIGRRLAAQIGGTVGGVALISSESTSAHQRAEELLTQVANGASAMEEIQASIASLVHQISSQNTLIDQSAAAIEQISANIDSVATVAKAKRGAAERLAGLTSSGTEKVALSERLIGEVSNTVGEVTGMIGVINGIAAQTNLLAMNAAIEAAHAGSFGRGFAVVAGEIRSLAESTGKNAGLINRTLAELGKKMTEARTASGQSGDAFRSIQDEAQSVSAAFGEITLSTEELATGSREIVEATEQLRNIALQTSRSGDEMQIGAQEVTSILSMTRDSSDATVRAMESIGGAARNVAAASGRISEQALANNDSIESMLGAIAEASEHERDAASAARRRLKVARIILGHIGWISRLRSGIDGTTELSSEAVPEAHDCELGRWIDSDADSTIDDPAVFRRITETHDELHRIGRTIIKRVRGGDHASIEIEDDFRRLLDLSRAIAEILSTYEDDVLVWTTEFSVKVDVFDKHHQHLFDLINEVHRAMRRGSDKATLEHVFSELVDYTVYHFSAEERAFAEFGYPIAPEHHKHHAELVAQATALRSDLEAGKEMVAIEVLQFLRDWITNHIKGVDARYSEFFAGKPVTQFIES